MNFSKEEPEEIEITPVPKARASAPVILSRESAAPKTKDKEKEVKQDAKESEQEKPEDIHVGLTRHDYKTLSNTPKMKEFEVSEKPSKIIKPHDYEMPVAEVAKGKLISQLFSKHIHQLEHHRLQQKLQAITLHILLKFCRRKGLVGFPRLTVLKKSRKVNLSRQNLHE